MKKRIAVLLLALLALAPSEVAFARGCIKGAIVGGVVGHYAGRHGTLGAIAGCLWGRHEAKKARPTYRRDWGAPQNEWRFNGSSRMIEAAARPS